ncbi:hypothetical protein K435DRAFT_967331 [Dendrothele bispora CBS 962.96]|uniref:AB hydrolase-1 domain-containing protein n=1 Tax=Dendrothele bispora (strain CBS 962.96) TaxID=1314807 RepID=A0A4S8LWF1_DENBC|nr:hypothetical protein K435DRAFT_967331 [Dendrothele bispora CBS 962.96]
MHSKHILPSSTSTVTLQPAYYKIQLYSSLGGCLHTNILAIDYRGFAERSGSPSLAGFVWDARAAWEWLLSQGARSEDILIMGHSLGTGVSAQLAGELSASFHPSLLSIGSILDQPTRVQAPFQELCRDRNALYMCVTPRYQ